MSIQIASAGYALCEAGHPCLQGSRSSGHEGISGGWRSLPQGSLLLLRSLSCCLQGCTGRSKVAPLVIVLVMDTSHIQQHGVTGLIYTPKNEVSPECVS